MNFPISECHSTANLIYLHFISMRWYGVIFLGWQFFGTKSWHNFLLMNKNVYQRKPRVTWFSFENVDMFVGHENCRTNTLFIYTVKNIETSCIVSFSAMITSTICLLDLSQNGRLLLKFWWFRGWPPRWNVAIALE
jgi:hypothetical protein